MSTDQPDRRSDDRTMRLLIDQVGDLTAAVGELGKAVKALDERRIREDAGEAARVEARTDRASVLRRVEALEQGRVALSGAGTLLRVAKEWAGFIIALVAIAITVANYLSK